MQTVRHTETSSGLVMMPRKGEPWHEYNYVYGSGWMRGMGWTKGFCRECGKWKLFHIDVVDTVADTEWAMAMRIPFVFNGGTRYYGTCTSGHHGALDPWIRPMPKKWARDASFEIPIAVGDRRDAIAKEAYFRWRAMFRKPEREAHYKPDHECDESCPEYDWGDYEDW